MNYIKRRFSSGDLQHDSFENVEPACQSAEVRSNSKVLLIIDDEDVDW